MLTEKTSIVFPDEKCNRTQDSMPGHAETNVADEEHLVQAAILQLLTLLIHRSCSKSVNTSRQELGTT